MNYNTNELLQKVIDYPHCPPICDEGYKKWDESKDNICELVIKKHGAGF